MSGETTSWVVVAEILCYCHIFSIRELSFKKGDFLDLLHTVDDNWLEAKLGDNKGIIPKNYVKVRGTTCSQLDSDGAPILVVN